MITLRIGDIVVECASAEIAVTVLEEMRMVLVPSTSEEAAAIRLALEGRHIGPIVAWAPEERV